MVRWYDGTFNCLFLISVDIFCLFPDVVDSRFTEQVDNLPDSVDSFPGFITFVNFLWHSRSQHQSG